MPQLEISKDEWTAMEAAKARREARSAVPKAAFVDARLVGKLPPLPRPTPRPVPAIPVTRKRGHLYVAPIGPMRLVERDIMSLSGVDCKPTRRRVSIAEIINIVAEVYGITKNDILSARRTAKIVRPRQEAMWLAKEFTLFSYPEIGRRFEGRDHTTVLHAVRKISGLIAEGKHEPRARPRVQAVQDRLAARWEAAYGADADEGRAKP
jgi:hypothetical protein